MRPRSHYAAFFVFAMLFSVLVGLVSGEVSLRLLEKFGSRRFGGLASVFSESFFFHHWKPGSPLYPSAEKFDPLLGWRAGSRAASVPGRITFNAQGWRSRVDYDRPKKKKRVVVIGDSYTFGSNLVDEETIAEQLERRLGKGHEVFSLAAEGYGLDQLVLAATEVATKLDPDFVIVGFIADDLRRSCLRFAWGQALKPYYELDGEGVALRATPLPSPEENRERHARWPRRVRDAIEASLAKSRALNVLASPFLRASESRCIDELNARLIAHASASWENRAPIRFFHLGGELPEGFVKALAGRGLRYESLAELEHAVARALGLTPGTSDGYHPDAVRARVIAELYRKSLVAASRELAGGSR